MKNLAQWMDGWEGKKGREKERKEVRRRPASTSEKEKKPLLINKEAKKKFHPLYCYNFSIYLINLKKYVCIRFILCIYIINALRKLII